MGTMLKKLESSEKQLTTMVLEQDDLCSRPMVPTLLWKALMKVVPQCVPLLFVAEISYGWHEAARVLVGSQS